MNIRKVVFCLVMAVMLNSGLSGLAADQEDLDKVFKSICPLEIYDLAKTIAGEPFAGRLTGHSGYTAAANWAATKFKEWGLHPIDKENGYLQAYPSPYTIIKNTEMTLFLPSFKNEKGEETPAAEKKLKILDEFLPLLYSDSGDRRAGLVFAGWGISAPEIGYDDYAGIDVKDKFVLCFRGVPDRKDQRFTEYDHHRKRMSTAAGKGAVGLIYIYDEIASNPNGDFIKGFLPAMINEQVAAEVLKEKNLTVENLKKKLLDSKKPESFVLNTEAQIKVESEHFANGIGYNIAGFIEGSDPKLKEECIILGGHYDHSGIHLGYHFPGANDNASGSAVVMGVAKAFSQLKIKPKRSVMFVLFGGEELGLQGSHYFAVHLPEPFKKVDAMLNFDMVGEGDGSSVAVTPDPADFKTTLENADKKVKTLRSTWPIKNVGVRSSDYAPFYLMGAACMSFFSNGPHVFYHQPQDTYYRLNPDMMGDVAKLAFLTAFTWADR